MGFNKNEGSRSSYKLKSQACLPGNFIYTNDIEMNRERLSKLSKRRLIDILLERESTKSHDGLSVKPQAVLSASFNPKSLLNYRLIAGLLIVGPRPILMEYGQPLFVWLSRD